MQNTYIPPYFQHQMLMMIERMKKVDDISIIVSNIDTINMRLSAIKKNITEIRIRDVAVDNTISAITDQMKESVETVQITAKDIDSIKKNIRELQYNALRNNLLFHYIDETEDEDAVDVAVKFYEK